MKKIIIVLVLLIPFYMFGQANVIEPELHSNRNLFQYKTFRFTEYNGLVFVNADDGENGNELWVFDGTTNSLRMVKDINPSGDSNPIIISNELDNYLLFTAKDDIDWGLWTTDGTDSNTRLLKYLYLNIDGNSGAILNDSLGGISYKGEIYFTASEPELFNNYELWKTDGTSEGTVKVIDLLGNFPSMVTNYSIINDKLIFQVLNDSMSQLALWSTDGTNEGTIKLSPNIYNDSKLISTMTHRFFLDKTNGFNSLFSTNGTPNGTSSLISEQIDLAFNLEAETTMKNLLFFNTKRETTKSEIWVSDGTKKGTKLLAEVSNLTNTIVKFIEPFSIESEKIYFVVHEKNNNSLWVSDGTTQGTKKISPSMKEIKSQNTVSNGIKLFFTADDNIHGKELWVSDGTVKGTYLVKDLVEGPNGTDLWISSIISNNKILFTFDNEYGFRLLGITDGNENGTFTLNLNPTDLSYISFSKEVFNNMMMFVEASKDYVFRIWQTNLTKVGTQLIMPKNENNKIHLDPLHFYNKEFNNSIYFFANYYGKSWQLYRIPNTISSVEDTQQQLLTVYPNPAKDYIQLELSKPMQLRIVNSTGANVKDYGLVEDGKLNVAELNSGVYFVVDEQGKNIAKFMKE